jgi:flagellin
MSNISLSKGVRTSLLSMQSTASLMEVVQGRLATGKKVNSALDNPLNFFTAASLNNRANDLSSLLDSMSNSVQTLKAADEGIKALTKLVESAKSLASQALATPVADATTRAALATQFGTIRTQIDQLSGDSGFNGVNLVGGDDLTVNFNEDASSSLTITGVDFSTAADLPIAAAAGSWATDANINAAMTEINAALTTLRTQAATFGNNLTIVQNRQDFTRNLISTLKAGADNLVLADTNEEGANLLALQTRQQLGSTALALSAQQDQQVLRLFG